jgi:hypothetical protein
MRAIAGLLLIVSATGLAAQALAESARLTPAQKALLNDVFVHRPPAGASQAQTFAPAPVAVRRTTREAVSASEVFALPVVTGSNLDQTHLLNTERLIEGQGLAVWRTEDVSFTARDGAVDTLRVSVGSLARGPGGVVTARPDALMTPDPEVFDVSFTRGWPAAWGLEAGRYALDVSPHAGVGFSDTGESAEAGALVRLGEALQDHVSRRFGFRTGEAAAADSQGGWFLFAAASGRAVGVNMAPSAPGWANEPATTLVSDAQAGLGWRRGDVQASIGYVHRDVKNQTVITSGSGPANYHDSMVGFSFSIRPH